MRKRYELKKKKGIKSSVYAIALVKRPANERPLGKFIFNKELFKLKETQDPKHLYASVLVPDQIIPRIDKETGEEYDVFFREETIRELARDFIKAGSYVTAFNSEHNEHEKLDGVAVTMSWTVDDPKGDKATKAGLDVVKGEWVFEIEVDNPDIRKDIEDKIIEGISIEAILDDYEANLSKTDLMEDQKTLLTQLTEAVKEAKAFLKGASKSSVKMASVTAEDGTAIYFDGELTQGANVYADEAMEVALADGSYSVDGVQVVVSGGIVQGAEEDEQEMKAAEELMSAQKELIAKNEELTAKVEELTKANEELSKAKTSEVEELSKELQETKTELAKVKAEPASKGAVRFHKSNPSESKVDKLFARFGTNN